jgi:CRISPR-associated protein Csb2
MWFCIEVRFLHRRYHGRGGWPPTPLRLFQAITAGALSGRWAVEGHPATKAALRWLEGRGAPARMMGPAGRDLRPYRLAVPNNQADRHVPALRKGARLDDLLRQDKELKQVQSLAVDRQPLVYAWEIAAEQEIQAEATRPVVRRLVALGTGLDRIQHPRSAMRRDAGQPYRPAPRRLGPPGGRRSPREPTGRSTRRQ